MSEGCLPVTTLTTIIRVVSLGLTERVRAGEQSGSLILVLVDDLCILLEQKLRVSSFLRIKSFNFFLENDWELGLLVPLLLEDKHLLDIRTVHVASLGR